VFIWAMILLVGVIFGVGSSWTFLQQQGRSLGGVSENDILLRQDIGRRLQAILVSTPSYFRGGEQFEMPFESWPRQIRLARHANSLGLQPAGGDLDRVVDDFLAKTTADGKRSYRELLQEHAGAKGEVTRPELRQFLAERTAVEALRISRLAAPAVPTTVAADIEVMSRTRVQVDEVVLEATHLLPTVAVDDPEIQVTYERLRATTFATPASLTATIVSADLTALAATIPVGEAEIQAFYAANKERWRLPAAPVVTPADPAQPTPVAEATYKPLSEVSGEISAELARTAAVAKAQAAVDAFNRVIEEKGLETADAATFATAATQAGLVVTANVVVAEPRNGMVTLGAFGQIKDQAGLFAKDPGFISNPMQGAGTTAAPGATGTDATWLIVRVEAKQAAGFKTVDEARAEVQQILAGNRAYAELLKQADVLRAQAEQRGPGGLAALIADPAQAAWKTKVDSRTLPPLTELKVPPTEVGGTPGESRLAISLTLAARPVVVAQRDGAAATVPSVRLVQVREVTLDPQPVAEGAERIASMAERYRSVLEQFREGLFDRELSDQLGN
jgi:hypothetical protein